MGIFIENGFAGTTSGADEFVTNDIITTGNVYWVDSQTGSDLNSGSEASPVATLAHAIALCVGSSGDIIVVKSGHTENVASPIVVNKAGIKIFGIGNGSAAPNFIAAAAIDAILVQANDVELNNLYFPIGISIANTSRAKVDARNVRLKGCTFLAGAFDLTSIYLTANAIDAKLESCSVSVVADGPNQGILVGSAAVSGLFIKDSSLNGGTQNFNVAGIYSAYAHLNFFYQTVTLTGGAQISHTANAKGVLSDIIAAQGSTVQT